MALRSLCGESEQAMPNIIIKDIIEVDIGAFDYWQGLVTE